MAALVKGWIHTDELMRPVLRKLRTTRRVSHVFVADLPGYYKLLFITNAAINIAPDLAIKAAILQNAVASVAVALIIGLRLLVARKDAKHHHMAFVMLVAFFYAKQTFAVQILLFSDLSLVALAYILPCRRFTVEAPTTHIDKHHDLRRKKRQSCAGAII